jgi:hypothetical protein
MMAMELMVSGPLPASVSVTVLAADAPLTLWLPKDMLSALSVAAGFPMPLPLSLTFWVEPATFPMLSVSTSVAE